MSRSPAFPSDTYFGGKALNRAASLVVIGEQLGVPDVVADLRAATTDALREWAEPDGARSGTPGAWSTTRRRGRRSA